MNFLAPINGEINPLSDEGKTVLAKTNEILLLQGFKIVLVEMASLKSLRLVRADVRAGWHLPEGK